MHELGRAEHASVGVPVVVRLNRRCAAHGAAVGGNAALGNRGGLLLLLLIVGVGDGLLFLLVGLLRGLIGRLLLVLLLHGLLLLLLLALLLHRILLLLLLRGNLGGRLLVVIVIAAADQRQTCRSDAGSSGGSQERAPAQPITPHALPVVSFAHLLAPLPVDLPTDLASVSGIT